MILPEHSSIKKEEKAMKWTSLKAGILFTFICILIILKITVNPSTKRVSITKDLIVSDFQGFGSEFNPFIYAPSNKEFTKVAGTQVLEDLVEKLRPQIVRLFIYLDWWRNHDTEHLNSLERTLELTKRVGADVHLTVAGGWNSPLYEEAAWQITAIETAVALESLIVQKEFTNIKYINIGNEPNRTQQRPETHVSLHLALDKALRDFGLREKVNIMAGDITAEGRETWLPYITEKFGHVLDSYSIHLYWQYTDKQDYIKKLSGLRNILAKAPASAQKPMLIMEYGNRGRMEPGMSAGPETGFDLEGVHITESPIAALDLAGFMIRALKHGIAGMSKWEMWDGHYTSTDPNGLIHYGLIGIIDGQWQPKPAYYIYSLFTRTTRKGWEVRDVTTSRNSDLIAVAMHGDDEWTVFILNEGSKREKVTVQGLPKTLDMREYSFSLISPNRAGEQSTWRWGEDSPFTYEIPPRTLTVLTSLEIENF